jgi:outer membrane protein W
MIFRPLLFLLFCTFPALSQVSYGLLGGVPFDSLTNGSYATADKSGNYTFGPTFQFGLPLGFRLEADALYRPLAVTAYGINSKASQWRIPVLAQYRFSGFHVAKPYVEAGYSYDHVELNIKPAIGPITIGPPIVVPVAAAPNLSVTSHHGFVVGAGLDFKVPLVRISPEIRYTHDTGAATVGNLLNTNQAEILVGVRF